MDFICPDCQWPHKCLAIEERAKVLRNMAQEYIARAQELEKA